MAFVLDDESNLATFSDQQLCEIIKKSPQTAPMSLVFVLSEKLIAKKYDLLHGKDVNRSIDTARSLGLNVSNIWRIVPSLGHAYFIMHRIPGKTLDTIWHSLGWIHSVRLAFQLRRQIRAMRTIKSPTVGSLETGECRSYFLDDMWGLPLKASLADVNYFIRFWLGFKDFRQAIKSAAMGELIEDQARERVPTVDHCVFTHHDLAPRNIILGPDDKIWLIDWDESGYYPVYFEYAGMQNFILPANWSRWTQIRWQLFSWIAAGFNQFETNLLRIVRSKSTRFRAARRIQLLKLGGPCRWTPTDD